MYLILVYSIKLVEGDWCSLGESVMVLTFLHSLHLVNQSTRPVAQGVHRLPPMRRSLGLLQGRQVRPHPKHMGRYDFISSHMHRRPPPICPIKGCVLPSLVSQSLALESSTSQNLTMTNTLDYALHHPCLENNHHAFGPLFLSRC